MPVAAAAVARITFLKSLMSIGLLSAYGTRSHG